MSRKRFSSPVEDFDDDFCEENSPSGNLFVPNLYPI